MREGSGREREKREWRGRKERRKERKIERRVRDKSEEENGRR